mgnify:CR=1 FL=1
MGKLQGFPNDQLIRIVTNQPKLRFVPHFGYVSLFPFLLKITGK